MTSLCDLEEKSESQMCSSVQNNKLCQIRYGTLQTDDLMRPTTIGLYRPMSYHFVRCNLQVQKSTMLNSALNKTDQEKMLNCMWLLGYSLAEGTQTVLTWHNEIKCDIVRLEDIGKEGPMYFGQSIKYPTNNCNDPESERIFYTVVYYARVLFTCSRSLNKSIYIL